MGKRFLVLFFISLVSSITNCTIPDELIDKMQQSDADAVATVLKGTKLSTQDKLALSSFAQNIIFKQKPDDMFYIRREQEYWIRLGLSAIPILPAILGFICTQSPRTDIPVAKIGGVVGVISTLATIYAFYDTITLMAAKKRTREQLYENAIRIKLLVDQLVVD